MIAETGSLSTLLALGAALYAALASSWGIRRRDSRWLQSGRNALYAATGLLGLAVLLLFLAFLSNDFQVSYVYQHSSLELPLYLKATAIWAGQEGSLLLWSFLQVAIAALVVRGTSEKQRPLTPWASVFLAVIGAFFVGVTFFLQNPFRLLPTVAANGQGLSPLLRHPGMVFHPPALYVGYVALAVPFAFAMAGLVTGKVADWPAAARRWTLTAWVFLGLGIFLGARWAYDVLGWGGYWGWDPVENAALMPWLVATALLHGSVLQEERGTFRTWNIVLAVLSFLFVLFGTFATRSGLIESVHAFGRSSLGYYFLGFMALTVLVSVVLTLRRRAALASTAEPRGLLSREGMFFLTLVVLMAITASVFIGSVLPSLTDALGGRRLEAGPEWFDRVTGPQFAVLVLLMGVCPLVGQSLASLRRLRARAVVPIVGALVLIVAAVITGFGKLGSIIGFGVVGLAGATILMEYVTAAASRSRRLDESPLRSLWHLFGRNRRRYGGYLVHIGIILMAIGVIGTRSYSQERDLVLASGDPASFGGYTFVYEEARQESAADHLSLIGRFTVYRDGAYLVTLQPQLQQYPGSEQNVAVPALRVSLKEDLYVVLSSVSGDGSSATIRVVVDPLVNFLWLGGLVLLAGGAIAVWPSTQLQRRTAAESRRGMVVTAAGLVLGVGIFVAAGAVMWAGGHGASVQASGRPLPGQTAPGFMTTSLDGSPLRLSDMAGQVVVVNFWSTWCQPCEDELPALQSVWEDYRDRGVLFVGLASNDQEPAVRAMTERLGVTYPVAMDNNEAIASTYGITGVPETFVLDREGRVAKVHIGQVSADQLRQDLDSLLGGQ